jgi:hypothetical protein
MANSNLHRILCSTYLRFDVAWWLHLMWYFEFLGGRSERLEQIIDLMDKANSSRLPVDGLIAEFGETHVTCANVQQREVIPMERFLFGQPRREVMEFADAFERFLWRLGRSDVILDKDGLVSWSQGTARNGLPQTTPQA